MKPTLSLLSLMTVCPCLHGCSETEGAPNKSGSRPAPKVQVAKTTPGELLLTKRYLAEVRPRLSASLAAGASGEVEKVSASEGAKVKKGDVLVTIDTSLVRAELKQAVAARRRLEEQRDQAERELRRVESLGPEVAPQVEAERFQAEVDALKAAVASQSALVQRARAQRRRHTVVAPFDGVVTSRRLDPGDWVSPGTPTLELVDPNTVDVFVPVPPQTAQRVSVGDQVTMHSSFGHIQGEIQGVVPALEPTTRTLLLRVVAKESASWLMPGGAVEVEVALQWKDPKAVVVPRDAVVSGLAGDRLVLVGKDNKVQHLPVKVQRGNNTSVLLHPHEKLQPGVVVVTKGNERLRPGQAVDVISKGEQGGDNE